jgi:hypothetical protein
LSTEEDPIVTVVNPAIAHFDISLQLFGMPLPVVTAGDFADSNVLTIVGFHAITGDVDGILAGDVDTGFVGEGPVFLDGQVDWRLWADDVQEGIVVDCEEWLLGVLFSAWWSLGGGLVELWKSLLTTLALDVFSFLLRVWQTLQFGGNDMFVREVHSGCDMLPEMETYRQHTPSTTECSQLIRSPSVAANKIDSLTPPY